MNAADAKRNIEPYGMVDSVDFKASSEIELVLKIATWATAKGYLMALEGEEVKALKERSEKDGYVRGLKDATQIIDDYPHLLMDDLVDIENKIHELIPKE